MSAQTYFQAAIAALTDLQQAQQENIDRAATLMVETIQADRSLFSFGATHSFMLTEELVYRTGGLMLVNPIYPHGMNHAVRPMTQTSRCERILGLGQELLAGSPAAAGDLLLLASTSGRNAVVIDMAISARERGIRTIALTALAYTKGVTSRHPSGKKLADLCDVVIDNGAPYGDAAVSIPGFGPKVGPLSSVTGIAIVNALACETATRLAAAGQVPPVFVSANLDEGDDHNERLLRQNAHRVHYMN